MPSLTDCLYARDLQVGDRVLFNIAGEDCEESWEPAVIERVRETDDDFVLDIAFAGGARLWLHVSAWYHAMHSLPRNRWAEVATLRRSILQRRVAAHRPHPAHAQKG